MPECKHDWVGNNGEFIEWMVCLVCNSDGHVLATDELKTLYNLIEHEYIPYENEAAHAVINKISKIIKENE